MSDQVSREVKKPTNSFEAWNYLFYNSKAVSVEAKAVSFILAGFWNMDGTKRCNPSLESIRERTGIKSDSTVRRALDELEAVGEWVGIRSKGHRTTRYYPMFVEGADLSLIELAKEEKLKRLELAAERKAKREGAAVEKPSAVTPTDIKVTPPTSVSSEGEVLDAKSFNLPQHLAEKVVTSRDIELVQSRLDAHELRNELGTQPAANANWVLDVISEQEFISFEVEAGNPSRVLMSGALDSYQDEEAAIWMEKFGHKFGSSVTYSKIQDAFEELIGVSPTMQDIIPVRAAMYVLGDDGFVPTKAAVGALMHAPKLDERMSDLRRTFLATARAMTATRAQLARGHFDTTRQELEHPEAVEQFPTEHYDTSDEAGAAW